MSAKALLTTPKKFRSKLFGSTTGKKKEHQLMTPQLYASVGSMSMDDSFGGDGGTASSSKKNSHFKELDSLLEKSPKQHIRHTSNPESNSNSNSNISPLYQEDAVVNTDTIVFEEKSSKDEHVENKKKVEQASLATIPQQSTALPHESIKQMILLVPPSPTKSRKKTRRKVRSLSPSKLSKTTGGQRAGSPVKKKVTKESKKDKDAENNKQLFPAQHEASSIRSERTAVVSNTSAAASSIISPRTTPKSHHRNSKTKTNHKGEDKDSPTTPRINEGGRTDEKVTSPSTPSKKRSSTRRTRSLSAKKHPPRTTKKESATRTRRKSHLGTVEYSSAKNQEGTKREEQQPCSPSVNKKSSKEDEGAEGCKQDRSKVKVLVQKLEAAIESSTSAKDETIKTSPPPRKRRSRSLRVAPVRHSLPSTSAKADDSGIVLVEKDKNEKKKAAVTSTPSIEPMPSSGITHKTSPRRRIKRSSSADLILEKAMASFGLVRQKKQPSPSPKVLQLSGKKKKTTKGKMNSSKKAHKTKNKDDPLLLSDDETKAESCTSGRDDDDSFPTAEGDSNVAILHTSQECFLQFTIPTLD